MTPLTTLALVLFAIAGVVLLGVLIDGRRASKRQAKQLAAQREEMRRELSEVLAPYTVSDDEPWPTFDREGR